MAFPTQTDSVATKCTMTLSFSDDRMSKSINSQSISFAHSSAIKAADLMASYMGAEEEWDKKLVNCICLDSTHQFDRYELRWIGAPHFFFGVQIDGERRLIYNEQLRESYVPIKKDNDDDAVIAVRFKDNSADSGYLLYYPEIAQSKDPAVVALFNSTSFGSFYRHSTSTRTYKKLDKWGVIRYGISKL